MPYPCSELLWSQSQECGLSSIAWKWLTSPRFSKTPLPFPPLPVPSSPHHRRGDRLCRWSTTTRYGSNGFLWDLVHAGTKFHPQFYPRQLRSTGEGCERCSNPRVGWNPYTDILGAGGGRREKNPPRHFTYRVVGYSPDLRTQLCFASVLAVSLLSFQQISYYTALDCYIFNQK